MPKKTLQVTPQLQEEICAFIRAGGFPHVAAEAAGVSREIFEDWLRRGHVKQPKPYYKAFLTAINQAKAHARLQAEIAAKTKTPSPGFVQAQAKKPRSPPDGRAQSPRKSPRTTARST